MTAPRDKCSSDGELTFSITPSLLLSSQPENFYRVPTIQGRSKGDREKLSMGDEETGKLDNKVLDSSRLFHCRHRTGSVERFHG